MLGLVIFPQQGSYFRLQMIVFAISIEIRPPVIFLRLSKTVRQKARVALRLSKNSACSQNFDRATDLDNQ